MNKQDHFLVFEDLFWQLSRKMGYLWKRIYVQTFPGSQSHIMYLLQQQGSKKMSEVAESLHLTAGAVTTASDQLIKQGYISRLRDENDRRVVRLALTEKGEVTLTKLQDEGREIMQSLFYGISDTDLEMVTAIFKQATTNIDNISKEYEQ